MDIWVNYMMDSARDRQRRLWQEAETYRMLQALPPRKLSGWQRFGRVVREPRLGSGRFAGSALRR